MKNRSRGVALLAFALVLSLIPFSANSNSHGAGPQGPPCGIYKVKKNEVIAGLNFPKGSYQINAFGISCSKVLGKKGLFAKFLKLKDKDPLPKPWKYLADAVGAPKFSSGPGVGFRVQFISQSTPTPTPTPTQSSFEAWTLNIDAKSLSDQAQENFLSWTKGRVGVTINHTQIIQVNSNVNRISILKRSDDLVAQLFSSYFPQGSVTVIGATESWTTEELSKNGWLTTCRNQSMPGVAYCLSNTRHHGYVVTGDATYDPRNPGRDGGALLAHEYFHLVQANLSQTTSGVRTKSGDADSANAFPAWFLEGTAEFVGYSVAAQSQSASFWDGRARMLSYAPPEESINKNAIADYEIRTCCGNNTPTYPYNIGQVATEYIVASIGFQKMLDIWIDYATTRNFEKSFERVTGISKIAFYEKFDQIRTKVGLPAISWRLEGLVNKKISN